MSVAAATGVERITGAFARAKAERRLAVLIYLTVGYPDRASTGSLLRAAIDGGINHIDTAQYYGLGVVKELIHEAPYPYPAALALVSKVAVRHVSRKAAADACSSSAARSRPARMCCRTG